MTLSEMHVWFRQYAQQMGMQNVLAVLPEQIDLLINTSITDTVNQIIRENIGITNDRVITDNSKLGQINALRSLYKVFEIPLFATVSNSNYYLKPEPLSGKISLTVEESSTTSDWTSAPQSKSEPGTGTTQSTQEVTLPSALFYVDFSIQYKTKKGTNNFENTRLFPVRIIDDAYLADTLNDFVLSPRKRSPIITIYSTPTQSTDRSTDNKEVYINSTFDLYFGIDGDDLDRLTNVVTLYPDMLRMSYISKPNKVQYVSDLGQGNTECDLPESMHVDILKHAVDLYRISVSGNLHANQQQQQQAGQDVARANARPQNEGYAS